MKEMILKLTVLVFTGIGILLFFAMILDFMFGA